MMMSAKAATDCVGRNAAAAADTPDEFDSIQ